MNPILFEYNRSVFVGDGNTVRDNAPIRFFLTKMAAIGYTLSDNLYHRLNRLDDGRMKDACEEIYDIAQKSKGADKNYQSLFKNFPHDVPDDGEYYAKRLLGHFYHMSGGKGTVLSCGCTIPDFLFDLSEFGGCPICQSQVDEIHSESENTNPNNTKALVEIRLAQVDDIFHIFKNLVTGKANLSPEDKNNLVSIIQMNPKKTYEIFEKQSVQNRVTNAIAIAEFFNSGRLLHYFLNDLTSVTDLLRIAAAISKANPALSENISFKLGNRARKEIIRLLIAFEASDDQILEDMLRHRNNWLRLGKYLHIGTSKHPRPVNLFNTLRNNEKDIQTFNKLTEEYKRTDIRKLIEHLAKRPGMFGRNLDFIARQNTIEPEFIINALVNVVHEIPSAMLLLIEAQNNVQERGNNRYIFLNNGRTTLKQIPENRDVNVLASSINEVISEELYRRTDNQYISGNVYIDPSLNKIVLPIYEKEASKSLNRMTVGSSFTVPEHDVIRLFTYWKQPENDRVDVDLSVGMFDEDWNSCGHVAYTNLSENGIKHSGDFQSAPNGASEFIDIQANLLEENVRYITIGVNSFTGQIFEEFECSAGIMGLTLEESDQLFDASAVDHRYEISGKYRFSVPLFYDVKENRVVWCDHKMRSGRYDNMYGTMDVLTATLPGYDKFAESRPNFFDLFFYHSQNADGISTTFQKDEHYDHIFDLKFVKENMSDIMSAWIP